VNVAPLPPVDVFLPMPDVALLHMDQVFVVLAETSALRLAEA